MCLITAAPKGTKKRGKDLESFIKNGMESNTDGSGFAYKRNGQSLVNIHKGFRDFNEMVDAIDKLKLKEEDELIIHHRIGTSGLKNEYNMHPFAVSESDSVLQTTKGSLNVPLMAHNGVFYKFTDRSSNFNDTYHFVQKFIAIPEITSLLTRDPSKFKELFDSMLGTNRLAFLFPNRDMVLIGDFKSEDGYYHSNGGYKRFVYDYGGSSQNNNSDDEDKDLEEYYLQKYGPSMGVSRSCKSDTCDISGKNEDTTNKNVVSTAFGRYIIANCYSFPIKHINIQKYNAHHFALIVKNPSISNNLSKYDVLNITDYDPAAIINWTTNTSNHNIMMGLNIMKCLRNGDLQLYIKKPLCEMYEGLYMLNEYICNKHNNIPPKSLLKNIAKTVNICVARRKNDASIIKFREFKTVHICHLKQINDFYNPVDKIARISNNENVITNSEIVEDTAS